MCSPFICMILFNPTVPRQVLLLFSFLLIDYLGSFGSWAMVTMPQ